MANQLKVPMQQSIITLHEQGWSNRRIVRELGVNRETVRRYVQAARASAKAAIPAPGSAAGEGAKCTIPAPGSGRRSGCEKFRALITGRLEQGLTARRIHQELVAEQAFPGGYNAVKRFVQKLRGTTPVPCRRLECAPGVEAQVDFGRGAPVVAPDGRRRFPKVFRIVLSHSRKGYSEAVWQESTEAFIRALENAFLAFGGVTQTLVIDNLRAAVTKADWFDPELNPKVVDFCRHYGTALLPTKPATPQHKGKVESGVKYVKRNALQGRCFTSLQAENRFLLDWEAKVADTRIHGTTKEQVQAAFARERPALQPLPAGLFPCFEEASRRVHRDGHVEVARAYYSVPPEYTRREVWVRWDLRTVRIFNRYQEPITTHARVEAGKFSTDPKHLPRHKLNSLERGQEWQLQQADWIGQNARRWAEAMLRCRGIQGLRVLQGLLSLPRHYAPAAIDRACAQAVALDAFRLRQLRQLLQQPAAAPGVVFLEQHELIRNLAVYGQLTQAREEARA